MAIIIRQSASQPWGFRLQGGKDRGLPFQLLKVCILYFVFYIFLYSVFCIQHFVFDDAHIISIQVPHDSFSSQSICICICICTCIFIFICIWICVCTCTCIFVSICISGATWQHCLSFRGKVWRLPCQDRGWSSSSLSCSLSSSSTSSLLSRSSSFVHL